MRKDWGWAAFGLVVLYSGALFAAMVRNPRYTGVPRMSVANFIDAQAFALTATVVALVALIVAMRRER